MAWLKFRSLSCDMNCWENSTRDFLRFCLDPLCKVPARERAPSPQAKTKRPTSAFESPKAPCSYVAYTWAPK